MNILLVGASGFIGSNLIIELAKDSSNVLTVVTKNKQYLNPVLKIGIQLNIIQMDFFEISNFDQLFIGQDIVYHLASSNIPTTSNNKVSIEFSSNINSTLKMLDACVKNRVKKIVFISSGGTVYGKQYSCPISEETPTFPITSYGLQKITIEKLLYLYQYSYGLDYCILRLSNPYGPYQRPNGQLGVLTTFTYKILKNEPITVYGDGSVIRDFIYIKDVVAAINKIVDNDAKYKIYNIGSGMGTSIKELISKIEDTLGIKACINYAAARNVDVPVNYLDIRRFENEFGELAITPIETGIKYTADFLLKTYMETSYEKSSLNS